jgi:hypothetical protein
MLVKDYIGHCDWIRSIKSFLSQGRKIRLRGKSFDLEDKTV